MGIGEPEIYINGRSIQEDAIDAVRIMRAEGHEMEAGEFWCIPECKACGPYRRTPEVEMHELRTLVQAKVSSMSPQDDRIKLVYHVNRTRLRELSKHPDVEVSAFGTIILGLTAFVQYTFNRPSGERVHGGLAEVRVRGLLPIAGK